MEKSSAAWQLIHDNIMGAHLNLASPPELLMHQAAPVLVPLCTRERWAEMLGLPVGVVVAQCERGMWGAPVRIGKRVFVNVEAIRLQCAQRAEEFSL